MHLLLKCPIYFVKLIVSLCLLFIETTMKPYMNFKGGQSARFWITFSLLICFTVCDNLNKKALDGSLHIHEMVKIGKY